MSPGRDSVSGVGCNCRGVSGAGGLKEEGKGQASFDSCEHYIMASRVSASSQTFVYVSNYLFTPAATAHINFPFFACKIAIQW